MTAIEPAVELFGIGSALQEARLRRGLDLADVESATCIRAANLAAIEEERFDDLAADVYTAGFIRSYAEFLGLDGDRFVAAFRDSRSFEPERIVHEPALAHAPSLRRPLLVAAAVLLACAAGVAALLLRPHSSPAPAPQAPGPAARAPAPRLESPLVIRAARGSTWVSVRFGDEHGRVVWQGRLRRRQQLRFGLDRPLWVGLGRPQTVDVLAGREAIRLAPGRSRFVFSSGGVARG